MTKKTKKPRTWVWKAISIISFLIALVSLLVLLLHYQPKANRLADVYYDFAVVEDYYEVEEIAMSIPLPSPLGPIKNLDYSPITVYETLPDSTVVDFRGASYGYILKLSTGLNTYLATIDSEDSPRLYVMYTIGQLRENRLRLRWHLYNGPIPPPDKWIENTN